MMPSHEVTESYKDKISALKSFGHTNESIARYLQIDAKTLTKYYKHELDTAQIHADYIVAGKLYKKAVIDEDLGAIIFWLKTRARWRTEDKNLQDSTEEVAREIKELRAKLDVQYKRDY